MLIQKDVKQYLFEKLGACSLRALLIQKDVKRIRNNYRSCIRLRALLIQKDVKLFYAATVTLSV